MLSLCNLSYLYLQNTLRIDVLLSPFHQIRTKCLESLCNLSGSSKLGSYRTGHQPLYKMTELTTKDHPQHLFFLSIQPAESEAFSSLYPLIFFLWPWKYFKLKKFQWTHSFPILIAKHYTALYLPVPLKSTQAPGFYLYPSQDLSKPLLVHNQYYYFF